MGEVGGGDPLGKPQKKVRSQVVRPLRPYPPPLETQGPTNLTRESKEEKTLFDKKL